MKNEIQKRNVKVLIKKQKHIIEIVETLKLKIVNLKNQNQNEKKAISCKKN